MKLLGNQPKKKDVLKAFKSYTNTFQEALMHVILDQN